MSQCADSPSLDSSSNEHFDSANLSCVMCSHLKVNNLFLISALKRTKAPAVQAPVSRAFESLVHSKLYKLYTLQDVTVHYK